MNKKPPALIAVDLIAVVVTAMAITAILGIWGIAIPDIVVKVEFTLLTLFFLVIVISMIIDRD